VAAPAPEVTVAAPAPLVDTGLAALTAGLEPELPSLADLEAGAAAMAGGPPPRVLRKSKPYYPRAARWQGIEGHVTLSYRLDAGGAPVALEVIEAEPAGQFEQAAVEAFERWRFDPEHAGNGRWTQTFEFSLGDDAGRCEVKLGSRICRRPPAASSTVSGGGEPVPGQLRFDQERLQHGFTRKGVTLRME
jgi:TonB family protein